MSTEEELCTLVLDSFANIQEVLNEAKDLEPSLKNIRLSEKDELQQILNKSKKSIDKLYSHCVDIRDAFYKHYNAITKQNDDSDVQRNESDAGTLNVAVDKDESVGKVTEQNEDSNVAVNGSSVQVVLENSPENGELVEDTNSDKNISSDLFPDNIDIEAVHGNTNEIIAKNNLETSNSDSVTDTEAPSCNIGIPDGNCLSGDKDESNVNMDGIDNESNIDENMNDKQDEDENSKEEEKTDDIDQKPIKSLIRLVDLSKLIDPRPKKSVKFDSSVIILTSSDEECYPLKKSDVKDQNSILKSALKNPQSSQINVKQTKDASDSEIEEVPVEVRVKNKTANSSLTNEKRKSNDRKYEKNSKIKRYSSKTSDIENDRNDSSDSDNHSSEISRKSSRLKQKDVSRIRSREKLRTILKRKSGKSSFEIVGKSKHSKDNGDSDSSRTSTKISSRKKKDGQEVLSDTSSVSENENNEIEKNHKLFKKGFASRKKSVPKKVEDEKFTHKVYIALPKIECDKLKDVYLRNKQILEIKSLSNLSSLQRAKRPLKPDSESSSDAEKPSVKKSKAKTSVTNISSSETSDAELLLNNTIDNLSKNDTSNENMADLVMNELQKLGDEQNKSESSNKDSEDEDEKSKKTKKVVEDKSPDKKLKSSNQIEDSKNDHGKSDEDENEKKNEESGSDDPSDDKNKKSKKTKWRNDKLLTGKIDSTDSEQEFSKYCKRKIASREELVRKARKRIKKAVVDSDSDSNKDKKKMDSSDEGKNNSSSSDNDSDEEKKSEDDEVVKKKPSRRRIRKNNDNSSSSEDDKSTRKQIRRVLDRDSLSETTKKAEAEEKERKARIAEKQKKYNNIFEETVDSTVDKVVLDFDEKEKEELLSVNKKIVKKLKPHQASGIRFMWDACFESLERTKSGKGSGCILAHCMGLGKTLQVIALAHTLLTNSEKTGIRKIMVVCPLNTVINWKNEFKKWIPKNNIFEVYELVSCKLNYERQYKIKEWHEEGGVLIIGYNMFRMLSNPDNKRISKKMRTSFQEGLVDPGPDLVVCDEGHLLKNEKTNLSIAMNRISTLRRIVLTGTPLQNNLKEYWCMVQFIKPNLLGTYKEYLNRFVNPITNGQYTDSTQRDIILMRKRSHVLHKLLDGIVQRRDYSVLEPYLPPKHEYVIFIQLTETQTKLYKHYMEKYARQNDGSNRTSFLFMDFQTFQRICTHPRVLKDYTSVRKEKFDDDEEEESEGSLKDFIDDGDGSSNNETSSSSSSGSDSEGSGNNEKTKSKGKQQKVRVTRAQAAQRRENNEDIDPEIIEPKKQWWQEYCDGDELDNINNSGKLFLLFQILKECEEIGDKVLVFSQSLLTLNCIEYFLEKIDEATQTGTSEKVGGHTGSWAIGLDYFRLDGSSKCENRATWCDSFNNPDNTRARLFLISTKAGGLGINLVAANRVIIFDVSWNPSHDIQSIYRVYRFGQTKPCYIYRFVTYGAMEMKVYERQVTKQAISKRVIDEQQIDRHYNQNDLQELYKCDLEPEVRPLPMVPKDVLLGEMLQKYDKIIYQYHLHQSLLENKEDEGLNEEERKAAWEEFENEKVMRKNTLNIGTNNVGMNAQTIAAALTNIVRKDNPTWSEVQIRGIIPALVQQLQVQLAENDLTMYSRVQQEIQIMQAIQAQKLKDAFYQQQMLRMFQHQQQQQAMLGSLKVNPAQLSRNYFNNIPRGPNQGGPSNANSRMNDVIELND